MPKVFYTEIDIVEMVKRGVMSLEVNDDVVLTDLAYEKANRLGLKLVRDKPDNPPAAPVRPYITQKAPENLPKHAPVRPYLAQQKADEQPKYIPERPYLMQQTEEGQPQAAPVAPTPRPAEGDLQQRIRSAVIAKMGNQVDPALLDTIIKRVLASTGIK